MIPTTASDSPAAAGAISPVGTRARLLTRILIAEDDPDIMALVALALRRFGGMDVTCCADGLAALERAASDLPELLLLDVMMPGLDGLETLARLRAVPRTAGIPVVFLTARIQPHDRARYLASGALGAIAKPFDPLTLAQQLRRLHADGG